MLTAQAWLVDLYDTLVEFDAERLWTSVAAAAGVTAVAFRSAADEHADAVMSGHVPLTHAIAAACLACDVPSRAAAAERTWRSVMVESVRWHDDAVRFLERLRARGVPVAIVSNCADDTPAVLDAMGLRGAVDAVVLSYEARSAKPDAGIFRAAATALGVDPGDAVLVDDQAAYCDGALAAGVAAVRIDRSAGIAPSGAWRVVRSLDELP